MRIPETLPHTGNQFEAHTLDVPPCCPVSRNPQAGSTITICYRPKTQVLEVGALYTYLHQYRGGLKDETGTVIVRDMETMIRRVATDCAQAVGVAVGVSASLVLAPKQTLVIMTRAVPEPLAESKETMR